MEIIKVEYRIPQHYIVVKDPKKVIKNNVCLEHFINNAPDFYLFLVSQGFTHEDVINLTRHKNLSTTRIKKNGKKTNILLRWR